MQKSAISTHSKTKDNPGSSKTTRSGAVDEFDYMTDWKRVFHQIWIQIKWLNSFGQINEVALLKILKKFKKNFFTFAERSVDSGEQI